mgnify:CR=1 FL=1
MNLSNSVTALTATLLMAGFAAAQAPVPPVAPPMVEAQVAPKPAVDPNTKVQGDIQVPEMTGDMIAQYYREYTGKRVIISKAALGMQISFVQDGPLTYGEAADLLLKTAWLEGLIFVPSGPNEVKLLPAPSIGNAASEIPIIGDESYLPENEQIVGYVMSFDNIKAEDAMSIFNGYVTSLGPQGVIIPVPNGNALLIKENSKLIRTLIELKKRIDVKQVGLTQKWVSIENADAEETVASVKEIMDYTAEQNAQVISGGAAAPTTGRNPVANQANNNKAGNIAQSTGKSTLLVKADVRTNRIFLMGRPVDTEIAESLITGFDAPLDKRSYYKQRLKFLSVSEFIPIAEKAISLTSSKPSEGAASGGGSRNTNRSNSGSRNSNGSTGNSGSGGGSGLADSSRAESPEAIILGKTMLVADSLNNTLIIKGPPQSIKVVKDLINEMDKAAEQVQISAVFGRYNISEGLDFRTDFGRTYQASRGGDSGFAGQSRTGAGLFTPATLSNLSSDSRSETNGATDGTAFNLSNIAAAASGLSLYGNIGNHFNATITALETAGRFKLTSRPTVFTTNNRKATLTSGQQIAVPSNSFQSGTTGGQSTNISYRDVLLELEVIPLVNSDDEVTLQISFTNQNLVGNQEIDGNEIPTIGEESLTTTVTVPNGQTIVLGGLITERKSDTEGGVPVLRKIPVVKHLFSSKAEDLVREELVIFIQPTIVNSRASLLGLQRQNGDDSQLVRDVRSGKSLLPPKFTKSNKRPIVIDLQEEKKKAKKKRNLFRGIRR